MYSFDADPVAPEVNVVTRSKEVVTDEERKEFDAILSSRTPRVTEFWSNKHKSEYQRNWDAFYKRNTNRAYKDRHWLQNEFPALRDVLSAAVPIRLFEVGCGVGNTFLPIVEKHAQVTACGVDLSEKAVNLCIERAGEDNKRVSVYVGDLCKETFEEISNGQQAEFDVCTMLFVLSAVPPSLWAAFLANVVATIRRGGILLFRDYGRFDMAEFRFKEANKLDEHMFVRQDNTLSYFFAREQVVELLESAGLELVKSEYFKKAETNRKTMKTRYRIFVNATFRLPVQETKDS